MIDYATYCRIHDEYHQQGLKVSRKVGEHLFGLRTFQQCRA